MTAQPMAGPGMAMPGMAPGMAMPGAGPPLQLISMAETQEPGDGQGMVRGHKEFARFTRRNGIQGTLLSKTSTIIVFIQKFFEHV